jgi:hypothetical protein
MRPISTPLGTFLSVTQHNSARVKKSVQPVLNLAKSIGLHQRIERQRKCEHDHEPRGHHGTGGRRALLPPQPHFQQRRGADG